MGGGGACRFVCVPYIFGLAERFNIFNVFRIYLVYVKQSEKCILVMVLLLIHS